LELLPENLKKRFENRKRKKKISPTIDEKIAEIENPENLKGAEFNSDDLEEYKNEIEENISDEIKISQQFANFSRRN
jgi:hypothetical protein